MNNKIMTINNNSRNSINKIIVYMSRIINNNSKYNKIKTIFNFKINNNTLNFRIK